MASAFVMAAKRTMDAKVEKRQESLKAWNASRDAATARIRHVLLTPRTMAKLDSVSMRDLGFWPNRKADTL